MMLLSFFFHLETFIAAILALIAFELNQKVKRPRLALRLPCSAGCI
jgi:hypothetical protein